MTVSTELLAMLVCPRCKGELTYRQEPEALICGACRLEYPVEEHIPIMMVDAARVSGASEPSSLDGR